MPSQDVPSSSSVDVPSVSIDELERTRTRILAFRRRYRTGSGDIARFESLVDEMFDSLVQAEDGAWPQRPRQDNLDTGNASRQTNPDFIQGLETAVRDVDALRAYSGPRPIEPLIRATFDWLARTGAISPQGSSTLALAVGAGTVNIYDAIVRKLVRRPGDAVLAPPMSYGYFMPQIERAGGRAAFLADRHWWRDAEESVGQAIDAYDRARRKTWQGAFLARMQVYAADISDRTGEPVAPFLEATTSLASDADRYSTAALFDILAGLAIAHLFRGDADGFADAESRPDSRLPMPGRVVGFFFTNPDTFGRTYSCEETGALASVLRKRQVALIEDWAYQSIGVNPGALGTMVEMPDCEVYLLLGLSKPLGIADCRIGLMAGKPQFLKPLYRILENSVGFVSTRFQIALAEALSGGALDKTCEENWSGPQGYAALRDLAIACFEGCTSPHLDDGARAVCRDAMRKFLVENPLAAFARETKNGPRRTLGAEVSLAVEFIEHGLRRWFRVAECPQAGFFLVVDCTPFLEEPPLALSDLVSSSFDVFAVLASLFGVRTIPEECQGDLDLRRCRHLRVTFSVQPQFLITAAITLFLGLKELDIEERLAR